jgi:MFS family permease
VLIDVLPLRRNREFRFLFSGQLVSALGNMFTYVALPVQIYNTTKSPSMVGLLGIVQLVPVAMTALWGGAYADAIDRRRLLRFAEAVLFCGSMLLAFNSMLPRPSIVLLFVVAASMSAVTGFHTPALESLTQKLVSPDELPAVSGLTSFRGTTAAIVGPSLAGVCIATFGLPLTFGLDALSFAISFLALSHIPSMPPAEGARPASIASILEGVRYAASRPELIGTYVVDIVALSCAMPMALFPALGAQWGGTRAVGYLYSAMSVGAFLISLLSGWTRGVKRWGAAVVLAAALWGACVIGLGYAQSLPMALGCLALAGAADMLSGLFRMTIWNETIPSELRGRMAGIEQVSYLTGPLLGNARAGVMAEQFGLVRAISCGGLLCVAGVVACIPILPAFWRYERQRATPAAAPLVDARAPVERRSRLRRAKLSWRKSRSTAGG